MCPATALNPIADPKGSATSGAIFSVSGDGFFQAAARADK